MFDDLFRNLQDTIASKVEETLKEVEKYFAFPEADGPYISIRKFTVDDLTVETDGITSIGENRWRIEAYGDKPKSITNIDPMRRVVLFEFAEPTVPECILACRFKAKAFKTKESIVVNLSRWEKSPIGMINRSWSTGISSKDNLHTFEILAHFKRNDIPARARIVIDFESNGILEIENIEILQASVKKSP
ncbi:hypothetical protein KR51_00006640 [Rubidibacter lacunae KORDI 51-2]|uniref:Uncharacterized protein n=1 Tax=Rubidibacter lacunae KORDI 51-2 TaxID=582515 RepID=U5DSH7_9CHRO|nr:hypothetical protein [Rubidibacter lacunae]ERN42635.1 hypothetical protein KR51_00006640 [Rubidibacter lacunae KORDI 51-2]